MTRLLHSERLKLTTTRTPYGLAAGLIAVVALFMILQLIFADRPSLENERDLLGVLGLDTFFALVLGILVSARGSTGTRRSPRRSCSSRRASAFSPPRLLVGIARGRPARGARRRISRSRSRSRGSRRATSPCRRRRRGPHGVRLAGGQRGWGGLGVAVGAALTNQVGALVAATAYIFVVESLVQGLLPEVGRFLPGGGVNADRRTGRGDDLPMWVGGLLGSATWPCCPPWPSPSRPGATSPEG